MPRNISHHGNRRGVLSYIPGGSLPEWKTDFGIPGTLPVTIPCDNGYPTNPVTYAMVFVNLT